MNERRVLFLNKNKNNKVFFILSLFNDYLITSPLYMVSCIFYHILFDGFRYNSSYILALYYKDRNN